MVRHSVWYNQVLIVNDGAAGVDDVRDIAFAFEFIGDHEGAAEPADFDRWVFEVV